MDISLHEENLESQLVKDVIDEMNDLAITEDQAFSRVAMKWLGYEIEDDFFIDGAGDRGIDFWYATEVGLDIFQLKSHQLQRGYLLDSSPFNNEGVLDLHRIKTYLLDKEGIPEHNSRLKKLKERWDHLVSSKKLSDVNDNEVRPIIVQLGLVVIGDGLTNAAQEEYEAFTRSLDNPIHFYDNVIIEFRPHLYTLKEIIERKWQENNREWKDIDGRKNDFIELHPENNETLSTSNSAVFYCPAIDLVIAYKKFGYQIFEPNVRCNIKKSKVNKAIYESIMHRTSRKEFRYLNNGITMICKNYSKPSANRKSFKVIEPGIVNGLQTVITLSEAYGDLSLTEKDDFEKNCYIMVRLLQENAVKEVDKVVRATNNQNTMEPRNLVSNTPEQILYEKLFADLGWFYQRKQGAWEAFSSDHRRWRTLPNKTKSNFIVNPSDGRSKVRSIDNEEIAQSWLSFIGFSDIAVHEKSKLFDEFEKYYNLVFFNRTLMHGYDGDYDLNRISDMSRKNAPSHELMLASFLARRFAKAMTLSPRENRERACQRLGKNLDISRMSREEVDAELTKDSEYLLGVALSGMSFTFVEYFGFALFRSLGENIHNIGPKLLKNRTLEELTKNNSFADIQGKVEDETFYSDDILCVLWHSFRHVVGEMMSGYWAESFLSATNRSRFIAHKDTRRKIMKGLIDLDQYTRRATFTRIWASGIELNMGVFGFIQKILLNS